MRKAYYVPGNSKTFNQYIKDLTGLVVTSSSLFIDQGEDLSPIPLADFSAMSADDRVEEVWDFCVFTSLDQGIIQPSCIQSSKT